MTFDTKNLVLSGGAADAKCLTDGTSNEDRDYLVVTSNFACSDDRAELASEALESDGPSSDSGHALTSWMTEDHDFPSPSFHFLSSINFTSRVY